MDLEVKIFIQNDKSYTVSFVKSKEGRRFGGFTDVEWDQSGSYKEGSNGFIFSLDNNEIYYNKDNYNIYCSSNCGPTFGGTSNLFGDIVDFSISDNCDKNNYSYDGSSHSYDTKGKKYILERTEYFYVEDYEVYKIELE